MWYVLSVMQDSSETVPPTNGYHIVLLLEEHQKNKIVTKTEIVEIVVDVVSSVSSGYNEVHIEKSDSLWLNYSICLLEGM